MNDNSMILFARPSFLEGMARVLDVGGTLNEYNSSLSPEQADYAALSADWRAVGEAIKQAATQFAQENNGSFEENE